MIIDCHGHYTTASPKLQAFRDEQLKLFSEGKDTTKVNMASVSDDEIIDSIVNNQLKLIKERGGDLTIFSPKASAMGHIRLIYRPRSHGRRNPMTSFIESVSYFLRTSRPGVRYPSRIIRRSSRRLRSYDDVLTWVLWDSI